MTIDEEYFYQGYGPGGSTSTAPQSSPCQWCSNGNQQIYHYGTCPRVKAIIYHPNGNVKRVEFVQEK